MNDGKIVIATLPTGGLSAQDTASRLTRALRTSYPQIPSDRFIQLPFVEGGEGTLDLLVTNTLGSFLEVEATGAAGEQLVVPLGFAGEDGKLGVIEMHRVASSSDHSGTSYGVGELIRDALDEGAFSVLLGHDEPLAADAGFGMAAALGVKFLDSKKQELDMCIASLSNVNEIDASGRAFEILSSRFYIARTEKACATSPSEVLQGELLRLAEIVRRDVGVPVRTTGLSASAVEFGLMAFLGAEVRDGMSLVIEATGIEKQIDSGECSALVVIAETPEELEREAVRNLLERSKTSVKHCSVIFRAKPAAATKKKLSQYGAVLSLEEAKLFAAPLTQDASLEVVRRDTLMRIEKLAGDIEIADKK